MNFGVLFLSFGGVILLLGVLGLKYGTRETLGGAGMLAAAMLLVGAVLFGSGLLGGRRTGSAAPR